MNIRILISGLILAAMQTVVTLPMAMADDDGHEWLKSAPAFCRSDKYDELTPKQMSKCDEAAFRYVSKHWQTITAANGQAYEIALDTITRPLPTNLDPVATLRAASVLVYISEGDTFNPDNELRFYFDCHDRFQTSSNYVWSPIAYAPPLSIAAKLSSVACHHAIFKIKKTKPPSITNDKSYDPIPSGWNIKIGLPGTLSVGAEYCTDSGACKVVGDEDDIEGFPVGGAVQACQIKPDYEPCLKARIPVEVLAMANTGIVIVRLKGINYAVSGRNWYMQEPDGSFIGGPISVIINQGVSKPLQLYMNVNFLPLTHP